MASVNIDSLFVFFGWVGAISFILAYFLLSINKLTANSLIYQILNVIGGLCLTLNALNLNDAPALITNAVWMFIGLFATLKIIRDKVQAKNT
ncbi:MAG: hypothetical protein CMO01_18530 [Thalassobius sp.]|nr:hypothetical protein [Thalassovita sp.]